MKKANIFISILIGVIGILTLLEVKTFPTGQNNVVGPGFFPTIIAIILVALGVILFIQAITTKKEDDIKINLLGSENKMAYLVMLITLVYLVAMGFVGFILSSIVYLAVLIIMYGEKSKVKAVICSVGISLLIYFVFNTLLSVPLP